jgi:hypothetical protein
MRTRPREYLHRKEAEGKSRIEALRCLKRLLARRYRRLLNASVNAPGCTLPGVRSSGVIGCDIA